MYLNPRHPLLRLRAGFVVGLLLGFLKVVERTLGSSESQSLAIANLLRRHNIAMHALVACTMGAHQWQ
jgi:hypothetical protein